MSGDGHWEVREAHDREATGYPVYSHPGPAGWGSGFAMARLWGGPHSHLEVQG